MDGSAAASLIVVEPSGRRTRVPLDRLPFRIGRNADNHFVVRDSRASRHHVEIDLRDGTYVLRDAKSRHGVLVNGSRVSDHVLHNSDKIEFGFPDACHFVFSMDGAELHKLMGRLAGEEDAARPQSRFGKLRAILEVARALQTSFSTHDVLCSVVDAALAITSAERGFLLLKNGEELEFRIARDQHGRDLAPGELRVPRRILHKALQSRRDLLSMQFDPLSETNPSPERSIADLELRSVVCVPLVRLNRASGESTSVLTAAAETVGVLYMDAKHVTADLGGGNRELLQTLAIEASTILENARLLEEERTKQRMEEELEVARSIQQNLLPKALPEDGWFRACGSSVPSYQVGGDYFDVTRVDEDTWSVVVADVSGKGVSSALLASLIQGVFVASAAGAMARNVERLNRFLNERTGGEKYATLFYAMVSRDGRLRYINAGHCAPALVGRDGSYRKLEATSMPVGMIETAEFAVAEERLRAGDRVVVYSDGVTEAQNGSREFFGKKRLREAIQGAAGVGCKELFEAVQGAVTAFTEGAAQSDDLTVLVVEYGG